MIIYLHGFLSSPASFKAQWLEAEMAARGLSHRLALPQLPVDPAAAISGISALIAQSRWPVTLVGSSLGGYYATWLAEHHDLRAVLINPAVVAHLSLADYIGPVRNYHSGETSRFTAGHVAALKALDVPQPTASRYLLMVEEGDEVLDARQAITRYAGCRQIVHPGGDHSYTHFEADLPALLAFAGF